MERQKVTLHWHELMAACVFLTASWASTLRAEEVYTIHPLKKLDQAITVDEAKDRLDRWKNAEGLPDVIEEALSLTVHESLPTEIRQQAFEQAINWMDLEKAAGRGNLLGCRLLSTSGDRITVNIAVVISSTYCTSGPYVLRKYTEIMASDRPLGGNVDEYAITNSEYIRSYAIESLLAREVVTPEMVINQVFPIVNDSRVSAIGRTNAIGVLANVLSESADAVSLETRLDVVRATVDLFSTKETSDDLRYAAGRLLYRAQNIPTEWMESVEATAVRHASLPESSAKLRTVCLQLILASPGGERGRIAAAALENLRTRPIRTKSGERVGRLALECLAKFGDGAENEVAAIQALADAPDVTQVIRDRADLLLKRWRSRDK